MSEEEVRVTSSTGGQKGSKIVRIDLVPADALQELGRVYGKGAEKYDDNNYRKGYNWSLSIAAAYRHLTAWISGEDTDPEIGTSHLMNVAWHMFTLYTFMNEHPEFDDRWVTVKKQKEQTQGEEQVMEMLTSPNVSSVVFTTSNPNTFNFDNRKLKADDHHPHRPATLGR